ncbi:MAG: hypothetical protein AAF358_00270 [Pseudomonadota bacterium]
MTGRPLQASLKLTGLVMWRGGLAFAAAAGLYYGAWQYIKLLSWPGAVKVAAAAAVAGTGLLLVSMILERRRDAQAEGNLTDD